MAALNDRRRSDGGGAGTDRARQNLWCVYTRVSQVAGCCDSRSRVHACRSLLTVRSRRRRRLRLRLRLRLREAEPLGRSLASRRRRRYRPASLASADDVSLASPVLFFPLFFPLYLPLVSRRASPPGGTLSRALSRSVREKTVPSTISRTRTGRRGDTFLPGREQCAPRVRRARLCPRLRSRRPTRIFRALDIRAVNIYIPLAGMCPSSEETPAFRDLEPMFYA